MDDMTINWTAVNVIFGILTFLGGIMFAVTAKIFNLSISQKLTNLKDEILTLIRIEFSNKELTNTKIEDLERRVDVLEAAKVRKQ